ncbi:MAG TPA: site-2 protease family protein, partial [Kofleriaceae bacterium]|nr:site-2 protease family protein [Kofleriaceae bacterium]
FRPVSVLYFLLLVGVLVVIHELGHFVAAKLLDVKVLRFSFGYGRPLLRVKLGETEYQIAAFPIGGYVRILGIEGDDPPDRRPGYGDRRSDAGRSFASRPLWQRLVIVFAGPAANLVLPVIIYFVFFAGHSVLPAAVIGDVIDNGAAARAGLEPGDHVLEIDGNPVRYWEEIETAVRSSPGKELHLRMSRNGKTFERYLTPLEETIRHRDSATTAQGRVGITHAPFIPLVGVIDGESPAARAGLRTGDLLISVDGQPVRNWTDVQRHIGKFARRTSLVYFRGAELPGVPQIQLLGAGFADLVPETQVDTTLHRQTYTGLEHAEMFVAHVDAGSPADSAGLRPGDLVTALDGVPVAHWVDLDQRLQAEPSKTFHLSWKRATGGTTETMSAELTQVLRQHLDDYDHTVTRLVFGARNDVDRGRGATIPIDGRFGFALGKAFQRTGETISTMVSGFFKILGGDTPGDALGGPLMMYRVASVSGNQGWDSFLLMLALISINLGLINLLPIPMLDGGHLLVFAIEAAQRRPLSTRMRERVQLVGLIVVGLITVLALRNDITRYLLR